MIADKFWVLFGAHTGGPDQIKIARFDSATGEITTPEPAATAANPAFLLFSADFRFLYATNQSDAFEPHVSGGVSAFAFDDATGALASLNMVSSHGLDPSHLAFDSDGRHLFIANYGSGTFSVRAIEADGSLGRETAFHKFEGSSIDPKRQTHPYAHASVLDPSGQYVLVCDLGSDKVWIFRYHAETGTLMGGPGFAAMPPGDGARHLVFHPNGRWLYVNGEMGNSVCRYDWNAASGTLTFASRTSTLPAAYAGASTTAELLVSDDGGHLYVTNRGHDSIVTMDIDEATGDPVVADFVPTGGGMPRNMSFSPDRRWLLVANHTGNNFTIYAADRTAGRLTQHGASIALEAPYCPRFVPIAAPS